MSLSNSRPLKAWYDRLAADRTAYLDRAETASEYTLPWYVRKDGSKDVKLEEPYQSVGAEGVTNLASRLVMVLLPPNRPPFRLRIARQIIAAKAQQATVDKDKLVTEINAALSRIEQEATGLIESTGDRTNLYAAMLHLLIAGNVLLYIRKDGMKVFSLRNYVVQRDPDGNVLTIIVKEEIAYDALPAKIRKAITVKKNLTEQESEELDEPYLCELYTCIKRYKDRWIVRQECEDMPVGKAGSYPLDACPWLPLRLYRSEEEDYGRGYVEQYHGSFHCLTVLSKAMTEASGASAKVVFLVHPNATTKVKALAEADNLAFVQGNKNDIDVLQIEKDHDLQVAKAQAQELTQQLSRVFLLNSSIQRDAERVTAEEIRYMAQELETALGGLYSVLAKEFQRPYVLLRLKYFQEEGKLIDFPNGVTPEIVTGVDALGRGQDATALAQFGQTMLTALPPQAVISYINVPSYLRALAASYGIDDTVVLKSDDQVAQEQAQAQQQQAVQAAIPNAVNQGGKIISDMMQNQQNQGGNEENGE